MMTKEELKDVLILRAQKHRGGRCALEGLPNKFLKAEYKIALPVEKTLTGEIEQA